MAIHRRNKLWQADIITAAGTRLRKSFPTKQSAQLFVKGHKAPAPKQGAAAIRTVTQLLSRTTLFTDSRHNQPAKRLIAVCGSKRGHEVTAGDVAEVCEGIAHLGNGTRIGYHSGLRRCLEVLDAKASAYGGIPHVKMSESRTVVVKDAEFEAVLKVASIPLSFILLATRDAALRAGTVYKLTGREIVKTHITTATKNGGAITVPMSPRLTALASLAIVRAQTAEQPLIHALGIPPSAWVSSYVTRQLKDAQKRVGVSGWTWHDLRRTAAQRLYEAGGDLRTVQSLLGHKSLGATLVYLNAQRKTITHADLQAFASGGQQ